VREFANPQPMQAKTQHIVGFLGAFDGLLQPTTDIS
jgi:hypothetical protein